MHCFAVAPEKDADPWDFRSGRSEASKFSSTLATRCFLQGIFLVDVHLLYLSTSEESSQFYAVFGARTL